MKNALILCTGNSARSIMAEALINRDGQGRLQAYSAGSRPKGEVHPESLRLLAREGHDISGLRSKSWDEFADAPAFDMVITVCDAAAGEACPLWPGAPVKGHWGIADPAAASAEAEEEAFRLAYVLLGARVAALLALPFETMTSGELADAIARIGKEGEGATEMARRRTA
jgi:protein-tyrosine-phosphatase